MKSGSELVLLPSDVDSSDPYSSEEEDWEDCLQEAMDPGVSSVQNEVTSKAALRDLEVTLGLNKAQLWSSWVAVQIVGSHANKSLFYEPARLLSVEPTGTVVTLERVVLALGQVVVH